jgi:hypothetical protein
MPCLNKKAVLKDDLPPSVYVFKEAVGILSWHIA